METLEQKKVKALKDHVCDYCGCKIHKGEMHEYQRNKSDGRLYTWRCHLHCQSLCSKMWNYVDPDNGMNSDEFIDSARELMCAFYCPGHCDKYDKELEDCNDEFDEDSCIRRFAEFMEGKELMLIANNNGMFWQLTEVEDGKKK